MSANARAKRGPCFSILLIAPFFAYSACAQSALPNSSNAPPGLMASAGDKRILIPRLDRAPALQDFLGMAPTNGFDGKLARIDGFIQSDPKDGQPATQRTVAYLGYDAKYLYIVFTAFDSQPSGVRARLTRREKIGDDDNVDVYLDTFHDQRRAFYFACNPLGVQRDSLHTEGQGNDNSFDTVWRSDGKLTSQGYVVWMAIPFRSLRFTAGAQTWGIILHRSIPRLNEDDEWPRVSSAIQGLLNQEGAMSGLDRISPGRNIQFIPYGILRSFRALDDRDPNAPRFAGKHVGGDIGLDTKLVLRDRLILDLTVNPDFSQVESDQPQNTVNQRFEVFFPEKRPFFLENSQFFDTPINLVFTRRIADPLFGTRLTGKLGPYALGFLFADDQSPGKSVPPTDPSSGKRAYFGVARINRDVGKDATIGLIYTERHVQGAYNRVGGIDTHFKFGKNWQGNAQAVTSSTLDTSGVHSGGPSYQGFLEYASRKVEVNSFYEDNSKGFLTQAGFFRRQDMRRFSNFAAYRFRPEGKHLISHGPAMFQLDRWAHDGLRLEENYNVNYRFEFQRQTSFGAFANTGHERLRPSDFSALPAHRDYVRGHRGFFLYSAFFPQLVVFGETGWGRATNFEPTSGPPAAARSHYVESGMTLHPASRLTIDNTYILTRLRVLNQNASIFNAHIVRSKWNYQFNRELSLRLIVQYNATLANQQFTSLATAKKVNADFLITYLLHPGTAIYVGYNSNLQNLDPSLIPLPSGGLLRTHNQFINDGRQFFVKVSYLLRF